MMIKHWFQSGTPMIWLNAGALAVSLAAVLGLLVLIAVRGLAYFWPSDVVEFDYRQQDGTTTHIMGEVRSKETISAERMRAAGIPVLEQFETVDRYLIKTGNRDQTGNDFQLVSALQIISTMGKPDKVLVLERREWGNFYGRLISIKDVSQVVAAGEAAWDELQPRLARALALHDKIRAIEKDDIGAINYRLEQLRRKRRALELRDAATPENLVPLEEESVQLQNKYQQLETSLFSLNQEIHRDSIEARIADGRLVDIPVATIVRAYRPNAMNMAQKTGLYLEKLWEFVSDEPREANTEGGIFPAIFGTVMLVMIMSVLVTPFGVIAAVYLREYAKQGPLTRTIRIAVNNLAGVPSIVYGVFGLGFFVYFIGGSLDSLFYPEALPAPTFGTPGILWSSLTLALLTLPVVIVSTEEGLARIPRSLREGSLALGATKLETLSKIVIPIASPAILTGMILAVARAAGEVAPLMLVGVVKLAPNLPLDGNFPFLHLDRKFMHLGFHIYDVGFQSPNVEASRPLVYATAFLLVLVIVALNMTAIRVRSHLREKYRTLEQ